MSAAAIKINGGGLTSGHCDISNEKLFHEAMKEGVTFDQFHSWITCRLEDIHWR